MQQKKAFVFDLDGTMNHAAPVPGGLPIRGRTTDSFLDSRTIELLLELMQVTDLYIATGRSLATVEDFRNHFSAAGVRISGWILEHGTQVEGHPTWTEKVLTGIDLATVHAQAKQIIHENGYAIDTEYYQEVHQSILLYSGKDRDEAETLLSRLAGVLNNRFRTIVGSRKIVIIPKSGDKYPAFQSVFGKTHLLCCAAGDMPDDLSLLRHATFPLTLRSASPLVQRYVKERSGFVAAEEGHEGTTAMLRAALAYFRSKHPGLPVPGPRLPLEEMESFRLSRCKFLDDLFSNARFPEETPDIDRMSQLASQLDRGKNTVVEVRMRDWGGEAKSLRSLLKTMVPLIPYALWRLVFRKERLGVENLQYFKAITERLHDFCFLPNGMHRFSAPGVPDSPQEERESAITLLLYDHPEDMAPWYDHAVTRLITRHPQNNKAWFINPMFLKISGVATVPVKKNRVTRQIQLAGPMVMMAANIVDDTDIRIAVQGFKQLSHAVDALIIAPRVITNPQRNKKIREAAASVSRDISFLSQLTPIDRSEILLVDTYGDLAELYAYCCITYLGGGFDARKRGFDPMESLAAEVPVILGPLYDFNRIAVDSFRQAGWVNILTQEETCVEDFVCMAEDLLEHQPDVHALHNILQIRKQDPRRIAEELLHDLVGRNVTT
jgi:hydroxymethylpyrimidine pyrophosphatase-like HAD family hydrolase